MGWQDLLQDEESMLVMPWMGGRRVHRDGRTWRVIGRAPTEHGWYLWRCGGRAASLVEQVDPDMDYEHSHNCHSGYLVGDRFIPLHARVDTDPDKLVEQTQPVYLLERGLNRFAPIRVAEDEEQRLIFVQEVFNLGPEDAVRRAFTQRAESIDNIPDVPPALELAFRFAAQQRANVERRRAELEQRRQAELRMAEARRKMGTGQGRRELAAVDFPAAARAALSVGGATYMDAREAYARGEMVVQYQLAGRLFECVVDRATLQIVDSGICLEDHRTGEKGDTYFSLESLPTVVKQAMDEGKLVVYRHVDGEDDWDE